MVHTSICALTGQSYAGFIALIVGLIVIIILSCSAIFYLLRHYDPTDAERAIRRQKRHQHQALPTSSAAFTYGASSVPKKARSSGLAGLFGFGGKSKEASRPEGTRMKLGRGGQGWVQASSGDEWDSDSGNEGGGRPRQVGRQLSEVAAQRGPVTQSIPLDTPFRPPVSSFSSMDSTSTVHFDPHAVVNLPYSKDSFPAPQPPLLDTHTRLSSAASSSAPSPIARTDSPEPFSASSPTAARISDERRNSSTQSARTFTGGTKFLEGL